MSVLASLYSGISGIVSNGSALSVSGDNIANMNTLAFKSGNALFESNLTQRIGDVEVGLGSRLAATSSSFTQGAFGSSTRSSDLAISGEGFFAVQSADAQQRFYTRAGSFTKDETGNLITTIGGYQLLGYEIDTDGTESTIEGPINFDARSSDPESSTRLSMSINLDPNATVLGGAFDGSSLSSAETSSNFSVPGVVYDSLGNPRQIVTFFRRTAANTWEYYTLTDVTNLSGSSGAGTAVIVAGDMQFDTDGSLLISTVSNDGNGLNTTSAVIQGGELLDDTTGIPWAGADVVDLFGIGAMPQATTGFAQTANAPEFVVDVGQLSSSEAEATQFYSSGGSSVSEVTTDGLAKGSLQSIEFLKTGVVRGIFSNGQSQDLYRIPLVRFANEEGLSRIGANLYAATSRSGDALLGRANSDGLGEIRSFSLEQSNVDLASEFVKIIQYQRAFQASSRTISAAADLLQDLVNLAR